MVCSLFPVDSLPGEDKYYIFIKGKYKVGRRGCDIIVNKDKGVSRIHAEIVVDAMSSLNPQQNKLSTAPAKVWLKDCSKYGTFVHRNGSKKNIRDLPNGETTIVDGDMVSFGTGTATYRFCVVPLVFFVPHSVAIQVNDLLEEKISSIGGRICYDLGPECTHVLAGENMLLKEDVIEAIIAQKPFVLSSWVEFVAGKSIRTEIPSCSSYAPTVILDGVSIKVADPKSRENCLKGFRFLMESTNMYKFKESLHLLMKMGGAEVLSREGLFSASQGSEDMDNNRVICVVPDETASEFDHSRKTNSLTRIKETDILRAVVSGQLDPSTIVSPPVFISSSCSTDETIVADSDDEIETAMTTHATNASDPQETIKIEGEVAITRNHFVNRSESSHATHAINVVVSEETAKIGNDVPMPKNHIGNRTENSQTMSFRHRIDDKVDTVNLSECGNTYVSFSQELIVRDSNFVVPVNSMTSTGVPNFKRFRKINNQSGNSFNSLIPFSKYPYKSSDCGNEEVLESMREEKKRKQMEAVADDLFNNQKGKQRGVPGPLHGLLTCG